MKKRLLALVLAFVLTFAVTTAASAQTDAEGNPLPELDKPVSIGVRANADDSSLLLRLTQPVSILQIIANKENLYSSAPYIELDIKIDNGGWFFDRTPGSFRDQWLEEYYTSKYPDISTGSIVLFPAHTIHDETNSYDSWIFPEFIGLDGWDMINSTYYFRYRYVYEYSVYDEASDTQGFKDVVSPWSDTAAIGKEASGQAPVSLEAPSNLTGELKKDENGRPYFAFTHTIPASVAEANRSVGIISVLDWKIGNGIWASEGAGQMIDQPGNILMSTMEFKPVNITGWSEDKIEQNTCYFRLCYTFTKTDGSVYRSPFSNILTIGVHAWSKASSWAEDELKKAEALGLIPLSLMGADLTKPITRAEFAAVSVKAYEALAETAAAPISDNPFSDTSDAEVLKAYNVGITDGVGNGRFEPNTLLNREQAATMLARVYKKVSLSGWTLKTDSQFSLKFTKPAAFDDDSKISSWAKDSVYFMAANSIINGTGNNMFSPRATTSAEEAVNYASATREQALLIAVRIVENLK